MAELRDTEFGKTIPAGGPAGLVVLAGEEKYRVRQLAERLFRRAEKDAFPDFNLGNFPSDTAIDKLADAALSVPFFGERRWVAAADLDVNALEKTELEKLFQLLDELPESTTLLLWYPTLEPKNEAPWKKLTDAAKKKGTLVLCQRYSARDLAVLAAKEAEKMGVALAPRAAEKLVEAVNLDMGHLRIELEKLCAFALASSGESGEPAAIDQQLVEEMTPKSGEATVFAMADALTAGQAQESFRLLNSLLLQRVKPKDILSNLSNTYVNLYRAKVALESGGGLEAALQYGQYKPGRNGKLPYPLVKAGASARKTELSVLRQSLALLLEAEMRFRGDSQLDQRLLLEELMVRLLLTAKGAR